MRQIRARRVAHGSRRRSMTLTVVVAAAATLGALGVASPALAFLQQDLQRFSDCPLTAAKVRKCVYSTTTSGEFVIGKSTVPINKTVTIQGGIAPGGVLIPAADGNTLSKTPLTVPGGLVGIELPGNFTEVTATAELAGPASIGPPVVLPLKVKLDNLLLGGGCYIGSESEPVALDLVFGETNPPPPNKPIKGSFSLHLADGGQVQVIKGTLVDNSFAAPGANGCTLLPLVGDLAVNVKVGLPSPAGTNTAIMSGGTTEEVNASLVAHVLPLPELGRCQKATPTTEGKKLVYHGAWLNSTCTIEYPSAELAGRYEWTSGPGPNAKFSAAGGPLKLETVGKSVLTCASSTGAGEYTGPKTQTLNLTLTGCKSKGAACQSSGAGAGEIRTAALDGSLGFISENEEPAKPLIGVDLKPASGSSLMSLECGGATTSVGGSVIVPITNLDAMNSTFSLRAKATAGLQAPEAFETGPKDTLTFGSEQAGLTMPVTSTNEEKLEIKGLPNP